MITIATIYWAVLHTVLPYQHQTVGQKKGDVVYEGKRQMMDMVNMIIKLIN